MIGILLTLMIFSLFISNLYHESKNLKKMRSRYKTYLCFKYQIFNTKKIIRRMEFINKAIVIANAATHVPATAKEALIILKGLIKSQEILYGSYMKNKIKNDFCSFKQTVPLAMKEIYLKSSFLTLKRDKFKRAILRKYKWDMAIYNLNKFQSPYPDFSLIASFYIKNSKINISSKEYKIPMEYAH